MKKPKPKEAGEPAINCAHDKIEPIESLKPNKRNPNRHGERQLAVYAKVLLHQGWRKAMVVSNQSGLIVTGEGAWLTARAEGWAVVPVDYQDFKSPEEELQHLLADNGLAQMSETNEEELAAILAQDLSGLDLELSGALADQPVRTELKPVKVRPPPKMAWVLVGIPVVRFSEINAEIERIAAVPDTIVETTVNDGELPPGSKN